MVKATLVSGSRGSNSAIVRQGDHGDCDSALLRPHNHDREHCANATMEKSGNLAQNTVIVQR